MSSVLLRSFKTQILYSHSSPLFGITFITHTFTVVLNTHLILQSYTMPSSSLSSRSPSTEARSTPPSSSASNGPHSTVNYTVAGQRAIDELQSKYSKQRDDAKTTFATTMFSISEAKKTAAAENTSDQLSRDWSEEEQTARDTFNRTTRSIQEEEDNPREKWKIQKQITAWEKISRLPSFRKSVSAVNLKLPCR